MTEDNHPIVTTRTIERQEIRISPLPTPEDLAGYQRILPEFPERLLKQFEEDSLLNRELQKAAQDATIELNKKEQEAEIAFDRRSQWMAYSLIMAGFVGTFILAYFDKDIAAALTGLGTCFFIFKGAFSHERQTKPPENDN